MSIMRRSVATAAVVGTLLTGGMAAPASANSHTVVQDGLVNVNVGNVTILEDVNVAVAAVDVADICGIQVVANVIALARDVDTTSNPVTVCRDENNRRVRIVQN